MVNWTLPVPIGGVAGPATNRVEPPLLGVLACWTWKAASEAARTSNTTLELGSGGQSQLLSDPHPATARSDAATRRRAWHMRMSPGDGFGTFSDAGARGAFRG